MFHDQRKIYLSTATKSLSDLVRHVSASQFLLDDKRQLLVQKIEELIHLDSARYGSLCAVLIENLINYCQNLPETANSFYSHAGGLMDHALNRTEAALSLFETFINQDPSMPVSEEQKQWQYALYSAAMLQGIGKLFVDYSVNLFDNSGQLLKPWNPLLDALNSKGCYYDYEFQKEADVEFRRRLNVLMAKVLMPTSGFAWIASHPEILAIWLALLNEDEGSAGTLGAILIRADALAIQRSFTQIMGKPSAYKGRRYGGIPGTFSDSVPKSLIIKEQALGVEFIQWLMKSLENGTLMINEPPLLMVPEGMVMCPEIFELFVRHYPEYNKEAVMRGFKSLNLHERTGDLTAISNNRTGKQKEGGIVIRNYGVLLPESFQAKQGLGIMATSATALIAHTNTRETQQGFAIRHLATLSTQGTWVSQHDQSSSPSSPSLTAPGLQKYV